MSGSGSYRRYGVWGMLLAMVALTGAAGCVPVVGHWTGGDLQPEMARDQFNLFRPEGSRDNFVNAELRVQQDSTFTGAVKYGDRLVNVAGRWKYDQNVPSLTLTDNEGHTQAYGVKKPDDSTLKLITGIKGSDVTLTLKKQQPQ